MKSEGTILVTGAAGLVGREMATYLHRSGYSVLGVLRSEPEELLPFPFIRQEVNATYLSQLKAHTLVHCASRKPGSFTGPEAVEVANYNRQLDDAVIAYCKQQNSRLVYISGTSLYQQTTSPADEQYPLEPLGPYLEEKAHSEQLIREQLQHYTILRVSAPYAPYQQVNNVLKIFIDKALKGEPIQYHGSGMRQQSFTHVRDIARAAEAAIQREINGIFNIADPQPISMKELAYLICSLVPDCSSSISSSGLPDAQEENRAAYSIDKAARELNWKPEISLEAGLKDWIQYLQTTLSN